MSPEMVRPSPIPDELSSGYFGRIKRLNGYKTEKEVWENIHPKDGRALRWSEPVYLEVLALVAGQTPEMFMRNHSIYACRRVITAARAEKSSGWALGHRGTPGSRAEMHFCVECAREDKSFHGVGIWRRSHHFPGQGRCFRHKSILRTASDPLAYLLATDDCLEQSTPIDLSADIEYEKNECIQRFYAIYEELVMQRTRIHRIKVVETIINQAQIKGFDPRCARRIKDGSTSIRPIVNYFKGEFPATWLAEVLPERSDLWIPDLLRPTVQLPPAAYILALAVFFDSAEASVNALMGIPMGGTLAVEPRLGVSLSN